MIEHGLNVGQGIIIVNDIGNCMISVGAYGTDTWGDADNDVGWGEVGFECIPSLCSKRCSISLNEGLVV